MLEVRKVSVLQLVLENCRRIVTLAGLACMLESVPSRESSEYSASRKRNRFSHHDNICNTQEGVVALFRRCNPNQYCRIHIPA